MKSALMTVGSFTVAMVITTVISVQRAPLPELPIDTLALADSLLADSLWRDSVSSLDGHEPMETGTQTANPLALAGVSTAQATPNAQQASSEDSVSAEEREEALQSLAQIFARMTPEAAAEILRHMSDAEVEGVVRNLGSRQAASLLSTLPEQRAAVLARRLMEGEGENH